MRFTSDRCSHWSPGAVVLFLDTPNSIHEKNRVIDHSGFPTWAIIVASFLKIGRHRITNSRQEGYASITS